MEIEALKAIELGIPLYQMAIYIGLLSLLMLLGYNRLGLAVSFGFVFYWGFVYNKEKFAPLFGSSLIFMSVYLLCGAIIIVLFLINFLSRD